MDYQGAVASKFGVCEHPQHANLYSTERSLMRNSALTLSLVFFLALPTSASAEIITFDFEGMAGADLDAGGSSGSTSVTVGGITLTLTASANSGVFNQTGTGFGINAAGTGDDTDAFDSQLINEAMSFTISSNVALVDLTLVSFDFDRFGNSADDVGAVTRNGVFLGGFALGTFTDSDLSGADVLTLNESGIVDADTFVLGSFGAQSGSTTQGFGLEGITFDATAATVPEPAAFGLLVAGIGFLFFRSRRRQQAATTA